MRIEMRPLTAITPYPHNPRRNDQAVDAVAASIRAFGFRQPIVVDALSEWDEERLVQELAQLQQTVVFFQPSALEVHRRTAAWFWDQEIFDFFGERLHLLQEASLRHYLAAWELKQARLDWKRLVLSRCLSGRALLVAQLQADATYASEAERVRAFIAQGGGSRSTYFNLARQQRAPVTAPAIRLQHRPPKRPVADGDSQWIWRPWQGRLEEN